MGGEGLRRRPRAQDERPVLELRIHGVNNTPPDSMLDVQPGEVEQVDGDHLGSFWRPSAAATARLRDDHPGRPPEGVTREAYSWGALARHDVRGGENAVGMAIGAVTRLGWALLVPFGLVNVAFWSRRLSPDDAPVTWQRGAAAAAVRVAATGLTLLLVGAACVVSLDLVASQCFAGDRRCDVLPTPFDGLADQTPGRRLALMAVVPLAVLGLLAGLGALTRSRYEQLAAMPAAAADIGPVDTGPSGTAVTGAPDPWDGERPPALLATPGFWSNARLTSTQGRVHLAAGLGFVVLSTSWYYVVEPVDDCRGEPDAGPVRVVPCLFQLALPENAQWWLAITPGLALLALVTLLVLLLRGERWAEVAELPGAPGGSQPAPGAAPRPAGGTTTPRVPRLARWVARILWVTAATTVAHLILLSREPLGRTAAGTGDPGAVPLLPHPTGSEGSLVLLVAVLLPLAVSGRRWRGGRTREKARQMWNGHAPAVFLVLAVGVGLAMTTFVVVGTGDWLNGDRSAGDLVRDEATAVVAPAEEAEGPHLRVPAFFVWYGLTLLGGLLAFALAAAIMARRVRRDLPAAPGSPEDVPAEAPVRWGSSPEVARRSGAEAARRRRRRTAGAAHRAEPAIGVLAVIMALCLTVALVLTVLSARTGDRWPDPDASLPAAARSWDRFWAELWVDLVDLAAWGAGATAVLVLTGLVGGAVAGKTRPLGLLWDLMCFLPRAGHPFGPPCYAERVVPELVRRYHEWLGEDEADDAPRRRIVISAHSLGAVLAVASILAARVELKSATVDRLALLTYGTQLRPYFGRIFPELLGPDVLGTAAGRGAQALTGDPWAALVRQDEAAARDLRSPTIADVSGTTVRALLTGDSGRVRWIDLWRRTDYLGFPVDRYVSSNIDRPAQEVDTSGYLPQIGTHGGYTRVGAYRDALAHLMRALR